MSIARKLIAIIMATCAATLLAAGSILIVRQRATLLEVKQRNLATQTDMLAESCKAALAFDDRADAERALAPLSADADVLFAGIYTLSGEVFATYSRNGARLEIPAIEDRQRPAGLSGGTLTVWRDITVDGEVIGSICLKSELRSISRVLRRSAFAMIGVLAGCLLIALLISFGVQRIVSKPIRELAYIARRVSEAHDYTLRGVRKSRDEVGLLIDAFNEMLDQVQGAEQALIRANETLEKRVAERTADLETTNRKLVDEIKEREKAERALQNTLDDLQRATRKLERSNRDLKDFVYVASHDLREPLRKVVAFGEILEKDLSGKLNEDNQEDFDFMINGARRMTQMLDGLLTYSRVGAQKTPFEEVDLDEVVRQCRQMEIAVALEETKGEIEVPEPLPSVEGDLIQLRQLMQNLIANGLKYHRQDVPPRITITSRPAEDHHVRIEVTDNGIGIDENFCSDVFLMFRRLHSRRRYEGAGIGLSVCKRIVERHGGEIGVEAAPDGGSTFWFTLKEAVPTAAGEKIQATKEEASDER